MHAKTLQDRMCWACRAGDVGTRSYDDTMPIGMIAHARIRVYHAGDPAAPSCEKEEGVMYTTSLEWLTRLTPAKAQQ